MSFCPILYPETLKFCIFHIVQTLFLVDGIVLTARASIGEQVQSFLVGGVIFQIGVWGTLFCRMLIGAATFCALKYLEKFWLHNVKHLSSTLQRGAAVAVNLLIGIVTLGDWATECTVVPQNM